MKTYTILLKDGSKKELKGNFLKEVLIKSNIMICRIEAVFEKKGGKYIYIGSMEGII